MKRVLAIRVEMRNLEQEALALACVLDPCV